MIFKNQNTSQNSQGFTLVEVAIGMAIFVMLLISGSAAITQTQKLAHSNVMHNTARTVMEGYMEQMKGIPYNQYLLTMADPTNDPIDTMGISSLIKSAEISYDDPLYINKENKKIVLLDITEEPDGTLIPSTMDIYITPTISDISVSEGIQVFEITLNFTYESVYSGSTKAYANSIRFIKTSVSEY